MLVRTKFLLPELKKKIYVFSDRSENAISKEMFALIVRVARKNEGVFLSPTLKPRSAQ